jgi:hypothetical protein
VGKPILSQLVGWLYALSAQTNTYPLLLLDGALGVNDPELKEVPRVPQVPLGFDRSELSVGANQLLASQFRLRQPRSPRAKRPRHGELGEPPQHPLDVHRVVQQPLHVAQVVRHRAQALAPRRQHLRPTGPNRRVNENACCRSQQLNLHSGRCLAELKGVANSRPFSLVCARLQRLHPQGCCREALRGAQPECLTAHAGACSPLSSCAERSAARTLAAVRRQCLPQPAPSSSPHTHGTHRAACSSSE